MIERKLNHVERVDFLEDTKAVEVISMAECIQFQTGWNNF